MGHTFRQRLATLATCTFFAASGLTAVAVATVTTPAAAATYTVTETNLCGGAGSFKTLLDQANANPGPDTIEFTAGLKVEAWTCNTLSSGITGYPLNTTGPLTIVGNGATVLGKQIYLNAAGRVNDPVQCPSTTAGTMMVAPSIGLLEVGDFDVDNTGVTLTVSDLNFDGMPSLFLVEKNATLTLTDSNAESTFALTANCNRAPIEVREGSVHLARVIFHNSSAPASDRYNALTTLAVVSGSQAGALTMDHVTMGSNFSGRAVYWQGTSIKIANSLILESGGLWLDAPSSQVVNSAIWSNSTNATDRIVSTVGTVRFDASTIYFNQPRCRQCSLPGLGLATAGTGRFDLHTTAIGAGADDANPEPLLWGNTAAFTSDNLTWVQPTSAQDAAAINVILPDALTGSPGLASSFVVGAFGDAIADLTPLLGTVGTPGVLLDAVDPGDCPGVNALRNPIDDTCITTDVLGHPRWDAGNGRRNIGAVQNVATPHLAVAAVGDTTVSLMWNRPAEPGSGTVTGYSVFHRPVGGSTYTRTDVTGADTTTLTVTGLTNGTPYEFHVVATYTSGSGPDSNVVQATPVGTIAPPTVAATPGNGLVQVSWTEPAPNGHPGPLSYYVVYRPTGTTTWTTGPGPLSGRITTVPGLTNGTTYDVAVLAVSTDGSSSVAGATTATPSASATTTTISGTLPESGSGDAPLAPAAAALVGCGVALVIVARRRRPVTRG